MANPSLTATVILPPSVENLLLKICAEQSLPSPDSRARRKLASIGEESSLKLLNTFSSPSNAGTSINRYIMYMSTGKGSSSAACSPQKKTCFSPQRSPVHTVRWFGSPSSSTEASITRVISPQSGLPLSSAEREASSMQLGASSMIPENPLRQTFISKLELPRSTSDNPMREALSPQLGLPSLDSDNVIRQENNPHSVPLRELEFRKSSSPACSPQKKTCFSPQRSPVPTVRWFGSPSPSTEYSITRVTSPQSGLPLSRTKRETSSMQLGASSMIPENPLRQTFLSKLELPPSISDNQMREAFSPQLGLPSLNSDNLVRQENNLHSVVLNELEFRKAFLMLCYTGGSKLEDAISVDRIHLLKTLGMYQFESEIWKAYGHKFIRKADRQMSVDWDSGKTHLYFCCVSKDGSYTFKGPHLKKEKTHLQRVLGDENVLNVKFAEVTHGNSTTLGSYCNGSRFNKIFRDGIFVGSRCYRFFVFKDGGKEEKNKDSTASAVKCYFVCMESHALNNKNKLHDISSKSVYEARCLFMHAHTVATVAKYMARFSLILSKTIKLEVDLASVNVEEIPDIPCLDEYGFEVFNEDGDLLIHTDGTGFISEDLAVRCPKDVYKGKSKSAFNGFLCNSEVVEKVSELQQLESHYLEPPLLIQCRMFHKGSAVKGTLLVNRKLPPRTIQYRPSMLKVTPDPELSNLTVNSLEIVGTSNRPKKTCLSRYLIVLLCHGGVPQQFFMDLLMNAMEEAHSAHYNKRAAFRVSLNYGDMDDYLGALMIASGIPIDEPYLQHRLSILMREVNKSLKGGRIPISDSFYLMGTADPTGMLKRDEVCIILDNGQISGKVLVFKHPGLHYGDIHVLNATYVEAMEDFVGNAKYAIFFPTKGQRSLTDEMAGSDLDGDMYFVSKNDQLLKYFKPSDPWIRSEYREHMINKTCSSMDSKEQIRDKKPKDLSAEELDHELFQLFLTTRFNPSRAIGMAADSWLAYMDRLLILNGDSADEKSTVNKKVLQLIDIYYDALDAPKSGMKIEIPDKLKPKRYPHYMEGRVPTYKSKSVLGLIFDKAGSYHTVDQDTKEITLLPCLDVEVPESCFKFWNEHYQTYLHEMADALNNSEEDTKDTKNERADEVINKYKQVLYRASDFEQSQRRIEDINDEALAIYKISYENARNKRKAGTCQFAWRVAGKALCMIYAKNQGDKSISCSLSFLRDVFG